MDLTLHNIPADLEHALVVRAAAEQKSVDHVAIEVLGAVLGVASAAPSQSRSDLSFMWADGPLEPEVIESLEAQRRIDPEMWR
jgi:hypothetical protein